MKILKYSLFGFGALVLLGVAAIAVFAMTFDPNRYKGQIEAAVKEKTGRTLKLQGDLKVAIFPSLGANVAKVTLSERAAGQEFLSLESAHASVALLPLLRGEVIVDTIKVAGLKADIVKDKNGKFNFDDLLESQQSKSAKGAKKEKSEPKTQGAVKFDIAGVGVERSSISYKDLASGQELSLSDMKLATGRISERADGKLEFAATVKGRNPTLDIRLSLNGGYRVDLEKEAASLEFTSKVDESTIQAKVDLAKFSPPAYVFDINVDRLNLDQYFPPKPKAAPAPAGKDGAKSEPSRQEDSPVDFSALKELNAKGKLQFGALQVKGLKLASLKAEVHAGNGRLDVSPHSANLYEGSMAGALSLQASGNRVVLKETLTNVSVGPLLKDVAQQDRLEGRGNVALEVAGGGATVNAIKKSLDGAAKVDLRDGAIKGIDIGEVLGKAKSALGKSEQGAADGKDRTDFTELNASFIIKNGVAHNQDLDAKAPLFRIGGAGDIDIGNSSINYVVKASVVASAKGQGGAGLEQLAGLTVPVKLSGPFDAMKYQVDYGAAAGELAKSKAGERAKEAIDKNKGKIEDKVRDRLKGLIDR